MLSKILEKVVFKQVSDFLSQNNLLHAKQSGFKSGHSTETALLSVTEALRVAKASAQSSVLILLDLSAAFDTVNHDILLSTLSELGISGKVKCWFESYLSGCSFIVLWQGQNLTNSSLVYLRDWYLDPFFFYLHHNTSPPDESQHPTVTSQFG